MSLTLGKGTPSFALDVGMDATVSMDIPSWSIAGLSVYNLPLPKPLLTP